MAGVFVRLKLALLGASFRRGWQPAVGLILGIVFVVPSAVAGAVVLAVVARRTAAGPAVLGATLLALTVGWVLGPLLFFGMDATLDPARLQLLPLTRRQRVTGLTAASMIGVAPLATLIVLVGVVAGFAPLGPGVVVVAVAAVVAFVLCIVASRAVATALASRLRTRRSQDFATVVFTLLAASVGLLGQVPSLLASALDEGGSRRLLEVLRRGGEAASLVPLAWPARAIVAAADGRLLESLAWLGGAVALVALLARWWVTALDRGLTVAPRAARVGDDLALYPRLLAGLPHNRLTATMAKELRYLWAVPQLRVQLLMLPLFAAAFVVAVAVVPSLRQPPLVVAPALLAWLQGLGSINLFGGDRAAVELLVLTGGPTRDDIAGKNLAAALVVVVLATLSAAGVAALTGGWTYLPAAVLATAALLGVAVGVGNVISVLAPFPLPESVTNPFATNAGMGLTTGLLQFVAVLGITVLLVPPAVGVALAALLRPGLLPLAVGASLAYGVGVWVLGLRVASARVRGRGPEFVAALSRAVA